jgi:hypothetical protein
MRPTRWTLVLVAASALLMAHGASAHEGEHANHLTVRVEDLAAGQSETFELAFENGSFAAGWVFLVYGGVQSNGTPVHVALSLPDGTPVADWVWTPGGFHVNTTRLPEESEYRLTLSNPSESQDVRYAFYYDQSCECLDKTVGLSGGPAIFNTHLEAGRTADLRLQIAHWDPEAGALVAPVGVRTDVIVATLSDDRALWPDDFEVLNRATTDGDELTISWTADESGVYYVWTTVLRGADPSTPVYLRPSIDLASGPEPAPSGGLVFVLAALALAVAWGHRRLTGTP